MLLWWNTIHFDEVVLSSNGVFYASSPRIQEVPWVNVHCTTLAMASKNPHSTITQYHSWKLHKPCMLLQWSPSPSACNIVDTFPIKNFINTLCLNVGWLFGALEYQSSCDPESSDGGIIFGQLTWVGLKSVWTIQQEGKRNEFLASGWIIHKNHITYFLTILIWVIIKPISMRKFLWSTIIDITFNTFFSVDLYLVLFSNKI
jgi:hypothetical protein